RAVNGLHTICAATSSLTESGTGTATSAATLMRCAQDPGWGNTVTRVPTGGVSTPGPVAATTPVASSPGTTGCPGRGGPTLTPRRSPGWIEKARTSTWICPGPGIGGSGISATSRTSAGSPAVA